MISVELKNEIKIIKYRRLSIDFCAEIPQLSQNKIPLKKFYINPGCKGKF